MHNDKDIIKDIYSKVDEIEKYSYEIVNKHNESVDVHALVYKINQQAHTVKHIINTYILDQTHDKR